MSVLTIGELVVDWLSLSSGQSIFKAREFYRAVGGNATNVAVGLRRLGTDVILIGKIGRDFHGEYIKQQLVAENIDLTHVLFDDSAAGTAQCYMTTTEQGDHHFRNFPNPHAADMLRPDELPLAAFRDARLLHVTGISLLADPRRSAILAAVQLCRQHDVIVSFDAGFPTGADEQVKLAASDLLYQGDLIKMNEVELRFWAGLPQDSSLEQMAAAVFDRYKPAALLVTRAARGSTIVTAGGSVDCRPHPVVAVSEVGAGDAFMAGVLHSLDGLGLNSPADLLGLTLADWLKVGLAGNVCGALATRSIDAQSSTPQLAEFQKSLSAMLPVS